MEIKHFEFIKDSSLPDYVLPGPVAVKSKDGIINKHLLIKLIYNDEIKGNHDDALDNFFDDLCDRFMDAMSEYRKLLKEKKSEVKTS